MRRHMKKKILSILTIFVLITMMTSTVSAGGNVKLSSVRFSLGSLVAEGFAGGLGRTDVTVVLDASGIPAITCTNPGGNAVPGQSSPKVTASGDQSLLGSDPLRKNGKSPFGVETEDPAPLAWDQAGCPGSKWTAQIDFVFWTNATISVYNTATNTLLVRQNYTCTTTRFPASVSCTLVN